jgi:uncharacterized protein (TIGR03437 family)
MRLNCKVFSNWHHRLAVAFGLIFCVATLLAAAPASQGLVLQVSSETAPAGGWAQIKVFAATPHLVAGGSISMDFDPAVFGNIASVAVFSATGDALGYANVQGQHVDAHFSSSSAGIGQLPSLPLFAVWIPLLAGAKAGASTAVTLDPTGSPWTDAQGNTYSVTVNSGAVTVGGGLSVASITPGGGLLPTGTVLRIAGTRFDSTTTVAIDGAAVASVRFINPQQMEATLGGAAELTGKHFRLANSSGEVLDYFSAFPSAPSTPPAGLSGSAGIHPLVPLNVFSNAVTDSNLLEHPASHRSLAMLNQDLTPVTVLLVPEPTTVTAKSFVIPPGTLYFIGPGEGTRITASAPIRMVEVLQIVNVQVYPATTSVSVFTPVVAIGPPLPLQVDLSQLTHDPAWSWQIGTPAPAPVNIPIGGGLGFTVSVSNAPWLSVTPMQGTAPATLSLKPNLEQLAQGVYTAALSVTPTVPDELATYPVRPIDFTVTLTVSAAPLISASTLYIVLSQDSPGGPLTGDNALTLSSNGLPAAFTMTASTNSGGPWLSAESTGAVTPATISVTVKLAGLSAGRYLGDLAIQGPANTLHVRVTLYVQPPGTGLSASSSPYFYMSAGAAASSSPQLISVWPTGVPVQVTAKTATGGPWLTADVIANAPNPAVIGVNASATNLAPGTYQGVVIISTTTLGSLEIPITLTVFNAQTTPTVTPSSLTLTAVAGQSAIAFLSVTSGGDPVLFGAAGSTGGTGNWLTAHPTALYPPLGQGTTPGVVYVEASSAQIGTYQGEVLVTWAKGTIHVPVTFTVTPAIVVPPPPLTTAILNAASQTPGQISPGEIITIFGLGLGPAPIGLHLDPSGKVATSLNGTQVTINDTPAPLVYASTGQLNAIVPYEAGTSGIARVRVSSNGAVSGAWDVPLAGAAPGIFTIGSTGAGQGAVLNQDSSVNGAANPAARGSVIQIFATGEGQTSPPGQTGVVTGSAGGAPILHVTVTIGGIEAPLQFAGSAPDAVAGLFQVNAEVPQGAPSRPAVPLVLSVGGVNSQSGVAIAVQ